MCYAADFVQALSIDKRGWKLMDMILSSMEIIIFLSYSL